VNTNDSQLARHNEPSLIVEFTQHLIDALKHLLVTGSLTTTKQHSHKICVVSTEYNTIQYKTL